MYMSVHLYLTITKAFKQCQIMCNTVKFVQITSNGLQWFPMMSSNILQNESV